ncbi:MAG: hypothetical protein IKA39_02455, partial [Clostridia bacterium]|nr:hypothetical protein [Clostridia bacterium]
MAGVVFSESSAKNDVLFGKFEAPIKAIIIGEIENGDREKNILNALFNIEKSDRFAETIVANSGFSTFKPKGEGEIAENDEYIVGYPKIIEHIEFAKEFAITRKMADDSKDVMSSEMRREPKAFADAYLETKLEVASRALANGTSTSFSYNGVDIDLSTGDGQPLFSTNHVSKNGKTQSNLYSNAFSADNLFKLIVEFRNRTDESGKLMGESPDVIVIPGNRAELEKTVITLFASEKVPGGNNNDANPFFNSMKVIVNPYWQANSDQYILMSTKLNEKLLGNVFFNRVDLDVMSEIDRKTRNYVW